MRWIMPPMTTKGYRWRYLTTGDAVQAALDWLEDEGWLHGYRAVKGQAAGKSPWCYAINPKILESIN